MIDVGTTFRACGDRVLSGSAKQEVASATVHGKGKMKELRDRLIRKVMDAHAASNVLEFVWEPKIEWMWDRTRFGYVAAITDLDDAGKDDWEFSVISSGYSTLKFKKPRRGILLLQTKSQEKVTQ